MTTPAKRELTVEDINSYMVNAYNNGELPWIKVIARYVNQLRLASKGEK